MVSLFLIAWLLLIPVVAQAITAEELRRIAGDAERSQRERSQRIKVTDLNSQLPRSQKKQKISEWEQLKKNDFSESPLPENILSPAAASSDPNGMGDAAQGDNVKPLLNGAAPRDRARSPGAPRAAKYGKPQSHSNVGLGKRESGNRTNATGFIPKDFPLVPSHEKKSLPPPGTPTPSYVYVAPARYSPANNSASSFKSSDAVAAKQRRFGIRIGSWFSARMNRETTNFDPGLIEIRVLEDVVGDHRMLPSGSLLFANKVFNQGTKRLDLKIIKGVLPDGEEIELDGLIYDSSRVAGLHGIVVENDAGAVSSGFKKGLVDAGRSIVSTAAGGTPAGIVLNATAGAVASAKQAAAAAEAAAPYTIHVSPQPVLVQVQATF